jgi:hypothetical protein
MRTVSCVVVVAPQQQNSVSDSHIYSPLNSGQFGGSTEAFLPLHRLSNMRDKVTSQVICGSVG